ncbi:MAG TPA: phosphate transport system regulatory protein PhoU [Verrucomicrobiales bacterium]|nr:phosphate transport system regulatory protein PhoU [Verrucomicrobiales bacterium]
MATHLEQSLQRDLDRIREKVREMGALGERALRDCVEALRTRNRQLAYTIILRDRRIDELEKAVDRLCLEFLVRQQPVAGHLRFAYSTIRINLELERVGDYAESIARQSMKLFPLDVKIPMERIEEIANLSIPMLHDAVDAFLNQDADLARRTMEIEDAVDVLKSSLNRDVVALFREQKIPFEALNPLMMITRRLERVSDQARNLCIEVLYMCTGENTRHRGSEGFRMLFVGDRNCCRSQMAEAIANSLEQDRFIFSSAGVTPGPVTPATLDFLRSKGHDVSRLAPKALAQIPNLDHYHVIVTLSKEAQKAFLPRPRKLVLLDWSVADPSAVTGSPAEVAAAFESTYRFLREHITDLVEAVLGDEDE